jgi:CBS domain-containing protein
LVGSKGTLDQAYRTIPRRGGSLPVVEDGKLVGIVTERDMLRTLSTSLPSAKRLDPDLFP